MDHRNLRRAAIAALAILASAGTAFGQGALKPVDANIVNTPSNPVPVTGTVTIGGSGVTGTLKSGDKTVTVHSSTIEVTSVVAANHQTPVLDVSDYKEVRVVISNGTCGPCSNLIAEVYALPATGSSYQIDEIPVNFSPTSFAAWATRTYSTPGARLLIALRATTGGSSNSARVALFGRTN
jgi:hypothetical protein